MPRRKTNKDYPATGQGQCSFLSIPKSIHTGDRLMSSKLSESKETDDDAAPESTENSSEVVMVEICRVSDTKGGFGPFPDPGIGGTFNR
jgi:hypothetical protein